MSDVIGKVELSVDKTQSAKVASVLQDYRDRNLCFYAFGDTESHRDGTYTVKNISIDDFGRLNGELAEKGITGLSWKRY